MIATPFLSKLRSRGFSRSPSSVPMEDEGVNNDIHKYKKCVEEVKRDYPHLSIGAQQQMALKQCGKMTAEPEPNRGPVPKRFSLPDVLLKDVMSKLNLGKYVIGLTDCSSNEDSTDVKKEKSFAVCQSVVISEEEQNMLAQMAWGESEEEDSLQDSLENIEKSLEDSLENIEKPCANRRSRRSVNSSFRQSLRASLISGNLSDVEEDEESNDSDPVEVENRNPDRSDILPREISALLDAFDNQKLMSIEPSRRKGGRLTGLNPRSINCHRRDRSNADESHSSSFLSVDSGDFAGDFSAWSRRSDCSD